MTAIKLSRDLDQTLSVIRNHLSLGYLKTRCRQFRSAATELKSARIIIEHVKPFREHLILLEYEGELAFEMGDLIQARKILSEGKRICRKSVPESSLAAQINRRLADVELALDNIDGAYKLAQKAFDIASKIGEQNEVGLAQVIISQIYALREDYHSALKFIKNSMEDLRNASDPYGVARSLLIQAEIYENSGMVSNAKIDKCFEEAYRIFSILKLKYSAGEVKFRHAEFCCTTSRISIGFKKLLESEFIFEKISEKNKIRSIKLFKQELSKQAVAAAISSDNEFKIFGDYFSENEYSGLKTGQIDSILDILGNRTGASRVVLFRVEPDVEKQIVAPNLSDTDIKRFSRRFIDLLGEEFSSEKPTLVLDSRRDPFINELKGSHTVELISSVIVVPMLQNNKIGGYLYLDRLSGNGNYVPFGQKELNFTVGFADLISLKLAEYEKYLLEEDNRRLKEQLMEKAAFPNIITKNKEFLEMLARVKQVVNSDISISLTGETGSGKDLLAKAIHYNSDRRDRRFISVNCAALPETLLESELFGYNRGAFTGADRDKTGLFEEADGGTFFLDEIADMPLSIQAKILRILEEQEIVRLGETKPIKVNVRILSATNKNLKTEMEAGRFRQDLFYRLTALCFEIPPLRDRKDDIPHLIKHFAGDLVDFTRDSIKMLVAFDWPGNVRELENEVKKLTLLAGEKELVGTDILSAKILEAGGVSPDQEKKLTTDVDFNEEFSLYDYLAEYERRFIIRALREHHCVKKHAAKSLNIPESTLRLKIKQYGIDIKNLSAA